MDFLYDRRNSGRHAVKKRYRNAPTQHTGASVLSPGARLLLRILREESAQTNGEAVMMATLGNSLKSQYSQYRAGCLKDLVLELTKAGRVTRRTKGTTATLSLSETVGAASTEAKTSSTEHPRRIGQKPCRYYMKTGECRFGNHCKFDHPPRSHSMSSPSARSSKSVTAKAACLDDWEDTDMETPRGRKSASTTPSDSLSQKPVARSSYTTPPRQQRRHKDKDNSADSSGGKRQVGHGPNNKPKKQISRSRQRNWFERCIINGKDFTRRDGGRNFLLAAVTEFKDDGPELLYRLVAPGESGSDMLKKAIIKVSQEDDFLTNSLLPFLERLGQKDMDVGTLAERAFNAFNTLY